MNEVSPIAPPTACPSWCEVDHEDGALACQSERRAVVRVPISESAASTVHAVQFSPDSDLRLVIDGQCFTLAAAREFAAKILETCDEVTPADSVAVEALRSVIRAAGYEPGHAVRDGMSVGQVSRGAVHFGSMLQELAAEV